MSTIQKGYKVEGERDTASPGIHLNGGELRARLIATGRLRPAGTFTPPPPPRLDAPTLGFMGTPEEQKTIDRAIAHGPETPTDRYRAMMAAKGGPQ
jgi:hypothetical protein